jgi:hypothetical protein
MCRANKMSSPNVLGILWHLRFVAPWVITAWTDCYWSFLRSNFAEVQPCSSEEAARQESRTLVSASRWRTEPHVACCAAIPVITHPPLSGSRPEWLLAVPCSKESLNATRFATMGGIKSNATAELLKIPKEAPRRFFQHLQDRWSKCVRAQGYYFAVCLAITLQYLHSENFLTARRIYVYKHDIVLHNSRRTTVISWYPAHWMQQIR